MKNILVIGATSTIAAETARLFAEEGHNLFLVARNTERLEILARDLGIRGAGKVHTAGLDANSFAEHSALVEKVFTDLGRLDVVLIAHGTLPDQRAVEADAELAVREFNTNAVSTISLLTILSERMRAQGSGVLAVISSVAGDRGRQSNYLYGAAKAAVSTYLQGLRNHLNDSGVHVLTIKPGMVDSAMTTHMDKGLLWARPPEIAAGIVKAIEKKRDVVYLPAFWRLIMLVIRSIPERFFKKLKL